MGRDIKKKKKPPQTLRKGMARLQAKTAEGRVVVSAPADVTKHHHLGSLNSRNLFSYNCRGWKSRSSCYLGLLPSEASLLDL